MALTGKRPRKPMTPEQEQAYQERRAKLKDLFATLSAMDPAQRDDMAMQCPALTCEGRVLSSSNKVLLMFQMAGVTVVGGFQQWKAQGRSVRKDEHGLYIWIPLGNKDDAGLVHMGDERRFRMVPVFDVSQTDVIEAAPVEA